MRNTQIFFLLISLFYFNTGFSATYNGPTKLSYRIEDNITIHGPATLNRVKTKVISIDGTVQFDHLKVYQTAEFTGPVEGQFGDFEYCKIKGPAKLSEIKAKKLDVIGTLNVNRLKVSDDLNVIGQLSTEEAEIGTLTITPNDAKETLLNKTHAKKIIVKSNKTANGTQVLKLMNNSIVDGSVIFESGHGKIETDQSSKIVGNVSGVEKSF